jgi:hypothetical protein
MFLVSPSRVHRWRLLLAWMITRHPKFKPLYHADVVGECYLKQAEFLAGAGYYIAAAMMARAGVEHRVKQFVMSALNKKPTEVDRVPVTSLCMWLSEAELLDRCFIHRARLFSRSAGRLCHNPDAEPSPLNERRRCMAIVRRGVAIGHGIDRAAEQFGGAT